VAVGLSFFFNQSIDALIIIAIVLLSRLLGLWQEKRAADAVQALLSIVKMEATVLRDGHRTNVPVDEIVPGDICMLNAGDIIPGDGVILESKDLFVDEAALTGETWKPFYKSKISRPLLIAMVLVLIITFALPYSPLSGLLGLRPLTASSMMLLGMITLLYVAASEVAKRIFLRQIAKDYPNQRFTRPKSEWKFRHGPCPT